MKYFNECKTMEDVKAQYKILAKKYHPDCGGDTATMQAINSEYSYACAKLLKGENLSQEETDEGIRLSEEYRAIIEQLMPLAGILIELVGSWLWVTGNTKPVKQQLSEAGLFYASKKVAWYYRADEHATKGGKRTLNEIREKYGSEPIEQRPKSFLR